LELAKTNPLESKSITNRLAIFNFVFIKIIFKIGRFVIPRFQDEICAKGLK
jgi:hypothetical protein